MSLRTALLLLAAMPGAALAQAPDASPRAAIDTATKLARWQLQRMTDTSHIARAGGETGNPRAWEQAAFWVGMTALADHGAPPDIAASILAMGRANQWQPGRLPFFADDHAITQSYLWAARHGAGKAPVQSVRRVFDNVVTTRRASRSPSSSRRRAAMAPPNASRAGAGATRCSWRRPRCSSSPTRPATGATATMRCARSGRR